MVDWHLDKVTDLKDTFKSPELNEHPVEGDNRIIITGPSYGLQLA